MVCLSLTTVSRSFFSLYGSCWDSVRTRSQKAFFRSAWRFIKAMRWTPASAARAAAVYDELTVPFTTHPTPEEPS